MEATFTMSIKEERQKRNWTQVDLAFFSRLNPAEISRIETGKLKPSPGQLQRIAKALGCRLEQIQITAN